jgi:hypothetical protein
VVEAEWMMSERVSPRLATWLNSSTASDQPDAGFVAALSAKVNSAPAPRGKPLHAS